MADNQTRRRNLQRAAGVVFVVAGFMWAAVVFLNPTNTTVDIVRILVGAEATYPILFGVSAAGWVLSEMYRE